jgi:hypothetical protein
MSTSQYSRDTLRSAVLAVSRGPRKGGEVSRTFQSHGLPCDLESRGQRIERLLFRCLPAQVRRRADANSESRVRVEARGAHCLLVVGPLFARSRVVAANAAGAGDGK